jgi:cytochrome c biogenesis protein CcmG/thiol:disulfide interchange protein DsbE
MTNATKAKQQARSGKQARREAEAAKKRQRNLLIGVGVVVAVALVAAVALTGGGGDDTSDATGPSPEGSVSIERAPGPALEQGETIPAFSAPELGGGSFEWSDFSSGPTVLAVWAPWCPHCQAELPRLAAALDGYPEVKLVTVATAIGQQPGPSVEGYLTDNGLTFPVGVDDANGTLMKGLGVEGFPTTYYVKDGSVVTRTEGEVDPAQLTSILDQLEAA